MYENIKNAEVREIMLDETLSSKDRLKKLTKLRDDARAEQRHRCACGHAGAGGPGPERFRRCREHAGGRAGLQHIGVGQVDLLAAGVGQDLAFADKVALGGDELPP